MIMKIFYLFKSMRIRHKLLISYSLAFLIVISLDSVIMYSLLGRTVRATLESELKNSTAALLNMVTTAASVSIKNHLRAVAEKNLDLVRYFYRRYQEGEMTLRQARDQAADLLLAQPIGTTGYIAVVNSKGVLLVHPKKELVGADISQHAFVRQMITRKEGYLEYNWRNPGEPKARPKAMYMTYFAPWDWIITVSSYRQEFNTLVNVDDFRDSVLALRFGKSGYAFVIDSQGNAIIHPKLQGINIFKNQSLAHEPLKTMLERKNGKLVYTWRNPGEPRARKKLVIFNYLSQYQWIVASSSYLDEFYSPLDTLAKVILFTLLASMIVILPISFWISNSITQPLARLIRRMNRGSGPEPLPAPRHQDEIKQLTHYFDLYTQRLESYSRTLQAEVAERRQTEEALRISQERYRSVMEAAPDPIIVYDMQGRVIYLNPAFTQVFGWTLQECQGKKMDHFVPPDSWRETRLGLKAIAAGRPLDSVETRRFTKNGKILDVSIRGSVYRDAQGRPLGSVIIHRDVTALKRLERELLDIGDRERQKIGQDLHDDLGPHLIGIEGLAKVLSKALSDTEPEQARFAAKIAELLKDAIAKTRRLARGLCPVYWVDHGLCPALEELAANTEAIFGLQCTFRGNGQVLISDHLAATHIFRIIQEAVHNAARHSGTDKIEIRLFEEKEKIVVTVEDSGCGIPAEPQSDGMGLRIMGFRAKMIGASLEIRRRRPCGTTVRLVLPQDRAANQKAGQSR